MKLEGAAEENILTLLCWDEKHAAGAGLSLAPELFSTKIYRKIAEAAFNHLRQYSQPPRHHLRDIFEDDLRKGADGRLLDNTLSAMEHAAPELQAEFILTTIDRFVRKRKLTLAIESASDALLDDDLEKAHGFIYKQDIGNAQQSPGIWLKDTNRMLGFMDKRDDDVFSSGITALDERGVMPARKTMWLFIAPPKRGKSWHLIEVGKMGLLQGKRVLHITLENSEELTAQRYIQSLFAMSKDQTGSIRTPMFTRGAGGHTTIDFDVRTPDALANASRAKLSERLATLKHKAPLLIKEFPTSTLTIAQLNAYLDMLERTENFTPDLLLVDYPDLMAIDSANLRIDTGRLFKELRGIAVKRNMALVTVTQGSKTAALSKTVTGTMVGEDYSKIATADTIVTYSQTAEERRVGLARMLVDGARGAGDKYIVLVSQSYATGQFCLDSVFMNNHMENEVERVAGDGKEED